MANPTGDTAQLFMPGTTPATAANFGVCFWTNNGEDTMEIYDVRERHATAGGDVGAVTGMLKVVGSGVAAASGVDALAAGMNLKSTADTPVVAGLHATLANRLVPPGASLAFVLTGTPTSLAGLGLTVRMRTFI